MKRTTILATSLAAALLGSAVVNAAPVTLQVCSGGSCWNGAYQIADATVVNWSDVETLENANGVSVDEWEAARGLNMDGWSLSMDSDPFVTNNFTITNTTGSTQIYTVGTTVGVAPAIPFASMQGSVGFSLTDNNGNGATLATSGVPLYRAQIDGNVARTLWNSPTSFTAPFGSTSSNIFFGFPTPESAPESVDASIGILMVFSLTSGDSVSFSSNFTVNEAVVPAPAAVWLFGSGLLGLVAAARRKVH